MINNELDTAAQRAAQLIRGADALLIGAGAGMGVDSGLPDFRGDQGFWRAYPALGKARLSFTDIADPRHFSSDPALAWGFYGHRLNLYRQTVPHAGFQLLHRWGKALPHGAFVFTSNVDGQFQKAGFSPEMLAEVHGSIHHLQCRRACTDGIWTADGFVPEVDDAACRLRNEPPSCPRCAAIARPNILMFGDGEWISDRTRQQMMRLDVWRPRAGRVVAIELGAGVHIPTVRYFCEDRADALIRINPTDADVPRPERDVSMRCGALAGLQAIDAAMTGG